MRELNRKTRVLEKAVEFILTYINSSNLLPGDSLPPRNDLAKQAGVSRHTMLDALALLKQEGTLDGVWGHRYRIKSTAAFQFRKLVGTDAKKRSAGKSMPIWVKIKNLLEKDILNGVFNYGVPLPSIKELLVRYNVSFATLKKALDSLYDDGLLVPHRKGYAVPALMGKKHLETIVLLLPGDERGTFPTSALNEVFLRVVETECVKAHIQLLPVTYFFRGEKLLFGSATLGVSDTIWDTSDVSGFLVLVLDPDSAGGPGELLQNLRGYEKPVAVFDQVGEWKNPRYHQKQLIKFFETSTSHFCGRMAATYLLSKGHTNVAYLSPYHASSWSVNRFEGLSQVFKKAGLSSGIAAYTFNYSSRVRHALRTDSIKKRYHFQPLIDAYTSWRQKADYLAKRQLDPVMRELVANHLPDIELKRQLRTMFDHALTITGHTAWVLASDFVAVTAMEYLMEKGIDVPQRLSLIGFDNTLEAIRYRITSFDFNVSSLVHGMLDYVLHPTQAKWTGNNTIQIEGMIIERRTTARRT